MSETQVSRSQRVRRSRAEADQLAAEYEASGLNRVAFCQARGVPKNTLARYIARRRREQAVSQPAQRWVAVEVAEPRRQGADLTMLLSGGLRIEVGRGFDAETLRRLIGALERS